MPFNPANQLEFLVEIEIDGVMVDITQRTRSVGKVRVRVGRSPGADQAETSRLECVIGNPDGNLTEGDPRSPWFPHVGRGTRIRFSVLDILGSPAVLFDGKIVSLRAGYPGGPDSTVSVIAVGRWGLLAISDEPLEPALHRTILADNPTYYWRIEDPAGSLVATNSLPGGGADLGVEGSVVWRELESPPGGSDGTNAAKLNDGVLSANINQSPPWTIEWSIRRPADGTLDSYPIFSFTYLVDTVSNGLLATVVLDTDVTPRDWYHFKMTGEQIGANWEIRWWKNGNAKGVFTSGTNQTLGSLTRLAAGAFLGTLASDFAIGYTAVYGHLNVDAQVHSNALQAFDGEMAHVRIGRLLNEEGVPVQVTGSRSVLTGRQTTSSLPSQIQACEDADQGLLGDGGAQGAVTYICVDQLTGKTPAVAVTQDSLSTELPTTWDFQQVRNYVVSTRANGGGTFTAQDPAHIAKVGARLKLPATVNVRTDVQLAADAGARLLSGTAPEPRYPSIPINMRSPSGALLADSVLALTLGSRMTVAEAALPTTHPPGGVDGLVIGWQHTLDAYEWIFAPSVIPYSPYIVGASNTDWSASKGIELMIARSTSDTSWTVHTLDGPKLTTDGTQMPHLFVTERGERINLTAASNVTPAFVAAGTAAHADNASVSPGLPAGLAAGDRLFVLAAIRNTAASVTNLDPNVWDLDVDMGNVKLFSKYAVSGESTPTVTFTSGSAGDTTSAQCAAWRGVGSRVHAVSPGQTNASAQDIAYPGLLVSRGNCLIIVCGWKQDDWTSVATLSGFTEVGEPATITGNDQGLVWDFVLQGTATNIPAGTFVVTGGLAASSKAAVVAMGTDVQTMTVTRAMNNISRAHSVGDTLEVYRPLIAALG